MPQEAALPHHLTREGSTVTVFAQNGQPLWSVGIAAATSQAILAQLSDHGGKYLVVGAAEGGEDTGKVLVYGPSGQLVWEQQTMEPYPYEAAAVNQMSVVGLLAADLWQDEKPCIVALSNDLGWMASKITVFDANGNKRRTYWHPGHLQGVLTFKPSQGERLRLVAWGYNNSMWAERPGPDGTPHYNGIVCLDPETMQGEAPPRHGRIRRGVEQWYALILPQGLLINNVVLRMPDEGGPEGRPGQSLQVSVSTGGFLYLGEDGSLVGRAEGDGYSGSGDERIEMLR
jgi:hypothetical protein